MEIHGIPWNSMEVFHTGIVSRCIVWSMCENLPYESVYFKELHNQQEYY